MPAAHTQDAGATTVVDGVLALRARLQRSSAFCVCLPAVEDMYSTDNCPKVPPTNLTSHDALSSSGRRGERRVRPSEAHGGR